MPFLFLCMVVIFFVILYFVVKFAVKQAILEIRNKAEFDSNVSDEDIVESEDGTIAKTVCPQCKRKHDMDYAKCPYCGHVHITL